MSVLLLQDGTRIAYQVQGPAAARDGQHAPTFVLTNGLTTNTAFWRNVLPLWAARHAVLTWDLPGHGDSSPARTPASASVEAQAAIVSQLMAASGIEHAVQVGWSTGCQVVLETYRRTPQLCDALVLVLGASGRVLDTTRLPLPGPVIDKLVRWTPRPIFAALYRGISRGTLLPFSHALGGALGLLGPLARPGDVQHVLRHIPTVDPGTLQTLLCSLAEHEGARVLANTRVPTLLIAGDKDPFAPSELVGLPLHRASPHVELLRLPEGTHTALLDHAPEIANAVESFVTRALGAGSPHQADYQTRVTP